MFLRVTLMRTNGECLGISVIGGRGMGHRLSNGEMRRGIFIKHISEHSPAARDNTLSPGDQILQVCTVNQVHWHPLMVLRSTENIKGLYVTLYSNIVFYLFWEDCFCRKILKKKVICGTDSL